jgi:hypothetical protein
MTRHLLLSLLENEFLRPDVLFSPIPKILSNVHAHIPHYTFTVVNPCSLRALQVNQYCSIFIQYVVKTRSYSRQQQISTPPLH